MDGLIVAKETLNGPQGVAMGFFMQAPKYVDVMALGVATAETYTIPTGAKYIIFSAQQGLDFYIRCDGSAAEVPSDEVADGTGAFLNPAQIDCRNISAISFIAPAAVIVTMAIYSGE